MNKLFKTVSPTPLSMLIAGLYAVICHGTFVLLFALEASKSLPAPALTYVCAPMLEHTVMSFTAVVIGAVLLSCVLKEREE